MEILIGQDKWDKSANPKKIILNTKTLVNNHMMIVGGSGSGKTYNLRKIIRDLVKDKKNTLVKMLQIQLSFQNLLQMDYNHYQYLLI